MKKLEKLIFYFLSIGMIITLIITFYQIIMRYLFNNSPSWTEEAVRLLFVWLSLIGAGYGIKEKIHIGIDSVVKLFPEKTQNAIQIIVNVLITLFGLFIAYYSIPIIRATSKQNSPALGIPMSIFYWAVLVFGILCIVFSIIEIARIIKTFNAKTSNKGGEVC